MPRAAILVSLLALLTACSGSTPSAEDGSTRFAITHVTVLPMESEEEVALEDQTVVVAEGKIVALGPSGDVAIPEGAAVVEGAGKFLLPGLFDTHVHLNPSEDEGHLALYLANGVTTVQSMHGTPEILVIRDRVNSGELLGPRMVTTGRPPPRSGWPPRSTPRRWSSGSTRRAMTPSRCTAMATAV